MYPLDKDILSLEMENTVEDLFIKKDTNVLSVLTRSIIKFEAVFGKIKHKYAKGDYSKLLRSNLINEEEISPFETDNEILASIMIDRSVDFITPLCSQYTYEGMIDEFFGINLNSISVDSEILEKKQKEKVKLDLSSNDKFGLFGFYW